MRELIGVTVAGSQHQKAKSVELDAALAPELPVYDHIVIVLEENKEFHQILGGPSNAAYLQSSPPRERIRAHFAARSSTAGAIISGGSSAATRRPQSVQTDRAVPRAREVDDGRADAVAHHTHARNRHLRRSAGSAPWQHLRSG